MTETNKPVHTLSYGTVQVTIWQNESELGTFFNVGIDRIYNKNNSWEKSRYFSQYDLCLLSKAILDAHTWIQNNKKAQVSDLHLPAICNVDENQESEH